MGLVTRTRQGAIQAGGRLAEAGMCVPDPCNRLPLTDVHRVLVTVSAGADRQDGAARVVVGHGSRKTGTFCTERKRGVDACRNREWVL